MNRDEIRKKTCIIIRKHEHYLQGTDMMTRGLIWTWSAWDAWKTRRMDEAKSVARATGGVMVLFNPIVGQKRVIGT